MSPTDPSRAAGPLVVAEAAGAADREAAFALRRAVFCAEQGVAPEIEFDGLDDACRHYLARRAGRPVGAARLRATGANTVKIERMAVAADARRSGVGAALLARLLTDAAAAGATLAVLHAQTHAAGFYARFGFAPDGAPFDEAGIPHLPMTRPL